MGNDELLNYISMFREKAEQGKLVIFVGAGVSCNVDGMPSWNALIQNMAKAIDYSRCDTCRHRLESCENTCLLKDDFSTDELLKVPQHVFNKDQELYYRILNESINLFKISLQARKERCSLDILTFIVVILKRDFRCTKP